jgi:hypothetical protein
MFYRRKKFWKRLLIVVLIVPVILFTLVTFIIYMKQDAIVKSVLKKANEDFYGLVTLEESHIAPFANFPYISIDLQGLKIFEDKDETLEPVVAIDDVYLGFNLFDLLRGDFNIASLKISHGDINIVEDEFGELNISKAFKTDKEPEEIQEDFNFDLKRLSLSEVDISKTNKDDLRFDAYFTYTDIGIRTKEDHTYFSIDGEFLLSIIDKGDTSFINTKKFDVDTKLDYFAKTEILSVGKSFVDIEGARFDFQGEVDLFNDAELNLSFTGKKPDFGLFIALAPDDLIPLLKSFENKGDVFFSALVIGKSANGHFPKIDAEFGCKNGFFKNPGTDKTLEELTFSGYFTTGDQPSLQTMKFGLNEFTARPETGVFDVKLTVENFESPDIDLNMSTVFDLDYLAKFLNVESLRDLKGLVQLKMNFHDIIDLNNPEKSIEKLNESYYTELIVEDLGFSIPGYNQRIDDIDVDIQVTGNRAVIRNFSIEVGNTDLSIKGDLSDLPAVIHHTNVPVVANLNLSSNVIDLNQLTGAKGVHVVEEMVKNFKMDIRFESSAKALTESPYLPVGEFFIQNLNADFTNYPHAVHDFHADVIIDTTNLKVVDFSGMIDDSDFHFNGHVKKYSLFFKEELNGDTRVEFDITSKLLQLEDVFSFGGEEMVPEDYRHEEFRDLKLHTDMEIHFRNNEFHSIDLYLTELTAKMKVHPMKLDRFSGRLHFENDHVSVEKLKGAIGRSDFLLDLDYFIGESKASKKKDNRIVFKSNRLDFDQLLAYDAKEAEEVHHDSVFSIFDIPFPDMSFDVQIGSMNYHNYLIDKIKAKMRTTDNHMLYVDTLRMYLAGGSMAMNGYFNGSDRNDIYFYPTIQLDKIDLDKLMLKFDNFGQDEVVSDNLHGRMSGKLSGKIHMHADLIPMIDKSEIMIDFDVVGGSIENYGPLKALSGYFEDDKLHKVLFDTLQNQLVMKNGEMVIPNMVINTNLGFVEISGKQDMNMNMEYYLKVPLKMVTSAGANKLFGKRKESDPEELYAFDPNKKYRYVNIKVTGNSEDYKISLGKNKGK